MIPAPFLFFLRLFEFYSSFAIFFLSKYLRFMHTSTHAKKTLHTVMLMMMTATMQYNILLHLLLLLFLRLEQKHQY